MCRDLAVDCAVHQAESRNRVVGTPSAPSVSVLTVRSRSKRHDGLLRPRFGSAVTRDTRVSSSSGELALLEAKSALALNLVDVTCGSVGLQDDLTR